jgi:hypothetical protein
VERRAANFILGPQASLGSEIALGTNNQPNTVSIRLVVPKTELERTGYSPETYQRKVASIVPDVLPAHVLYQIDCQFE